jgi:hypothetical protein
MPTCRSRISALRAPIIVTKTADMSSSCVLNNHLPPPGGLLREVRDRRMRMFAGSRQISSVLHASLRKEASKSWSSSSCMCLSDSGPSSEERFKSSRCAPFFPHPSFSYSRNSFPESIGVLKRFEMHHSENEARLLIHKGRVSSLIPILVLLVPARSFTVGDSVNPQDPGR